MCYALDAQKESADANRYYWSAKENFQRRSWRRLFVKKRRCLYDATECLWQNCDFV